MTYKPDITNNPAVNIYILADAKDVPINSGGLNLFYARLFGIGALIIMSIVLVAIFPQIFSKWNIGYGKRFWWAMLTGLISMIVVPIVIFALFITVIGAPLGFLLLLIWVATAMVSMTFASYFIGSLIARKLHPVLIVLIGGVVLGLLELIPVVGWVFALLAYWLGMGLLLSGIKNSFNNSKLHTTFN